MANINDNWQELLPLIYIHIHRTVKQAVKEAIAELNQQETLNARDCSEYLCIGLDALYKMVKNGEIPHSRIGKRKLVFHKHEIDDFIHSKKINNIKKK